MSDKVKITALLIGFSSLTAMAFLGLGLMIGYQNGVSKCKETVVSIDTVVQIDTASFGTQEGTHDTIIKTVYLPYPVPHQIHDTVEVVDSVVVQLPIESHHCHIEDTADIWYSGFAAMIDSLKIYNHTTSITKTEIVKETAYRNTMSVVGGIDELSIMYGRDLGRLYVGFSAGYRFDKTPQVRGLVGFRF